MSALEVCGGSYKPPSMLAQDGKGMCRVCGSWRPLLSRFPGQTKAVRKHRATPASRGVSRG
jgi:hypothetical protein